MVKKELEIVEISDVVILTTWQNKRKSLYYKLFHHVVVLTTLIITVYIIYNFMLVANFNYYKNYITPSSNARAREGG